MHQSTAPAIASATHQCYTRICGRTAKPSTTARSRGYSTRENRRATSAYPAARTAGCPRTAQPARRDNWRLSWMRAATLPVHRDDRQQDQSADDVAREHKGERADIIRRRRSPRTPHPDGGRQEARSKEFRSFISVFLSLICGFSKEQASKRFFRGTANQI